MKLNPELIAINDFVDSVVAELSPPLTIESINKSLKQHLFKVITQKKEDKVLLIENCKKRQRLLSLYFSKMTDYEIHVNTLKEEIINQALHIPYQFIVWNIDHLFNEIYSILKVIRSHVSKNKDTAIFLITNSQSNFEQLDLATFDKDIELLKPFDPNHLELMLHKFELLYVKKVLAAK